MPSRVARTRQTCRHLPKAIFEKNVTRLDKFAQVMRESREFGASGHSLDIFQIRQKINGTVFFLRISVYLNFNIKINNLVLNIEQTI